MFSKLFTLVRLRWVVFFLVGCCIVVLIPCPAGVEDKTSSIYLQTLSLFDEASPGFGLDSGKKDKPLNYPMAYALYASAEALRYQHSQDLQALLNAIHATRWLVDHADLDNDGRPGWGLPFSWDAFGDHSVNPENLAYGITTAIVVKALFDVYDACPFFSYRVLRHELFTLAEEALTSYLLVASDQNKNEMVFWYSVNPADRYHVINVSSMLIGQCQRLSFYRGSKKPSNMARVQGETVPEVPQSNKGIDFSRVADDGVRYILRLQLLDRQRLPFWLYSGDHHRPDILNRPNDLVHACYVIEGLLEYKIYGGKLSHLINERSLYMSLQVFLRDNTVYEYSQNWQAPEKWSLTVKRKARLWAVGQALFTTLWLESQLNIPAKLSEQIYAVAKRDYKRDPGWLFSPDYDDFNFYPRQVGHLLIGLSLADGNKLKID